MGGWSSRSKDITFENITFPFVIGKGNTGITEDLSGSGWYVAAVSMLNSTSTKRSIYATCTNDPVSFGNAVEGKTIILDGTHQWNGTASIISADFPNAANISGDSGENWPFGAIKDVTIVHPGKKPAVFFQWLSSASCSSLQLTAPKLSSLEKKVSLRYKWWSSSSYKETLVTLPYTFKGKAIPQWIVLGLYFDSPVSNTSEVYAHCTNDVATAPEVIFNLNPIDRQKEILLGNSSTVARQCVFSDIDKRNPNHWYEKYVTALCSAGIIVGYETGGLPEYRPDQSANWAEVTKVIELSNNQRSAKAECESTGGSWYRCYLNRASRSGYSKSADSRVRRGDVLKYASKTFFNRSFSRWSEAAAYMKSQGVIHGVNGRIDSDYLNTFLTRGELAKIALKSAQLSNRSLAYGVVPISKYGSPSPVSATPLLEKGTLSTTKVDKDLPKSLAPVPPKALSVPEMEKSIVEAAEKTIGKKGYPYTVNEKTNNQGVVNIIYKQEAKYSTVKEEKDNYESKGVLKGMPASPNNQPSPVIPKGSKVFISETTPGTNGQGTVGIADGKGNVILSTDSEKGVQKVQIPENSSYVEPIDAKSKY